MDGVIDIGRRQRKREAVHRCVLQAADQLFRERGIAGTTVDDIAQTADVARQTVFNHFPYKEALALELGARGIDKVAQYAYALLEAGRPAAEVLRCAAESVLDVAIEDGELAVVVARELLHPDPERAARAAERFPLRQLFEALLVQAREEGAVREDLPLDVVASRLSAILTTLVAQVFITDAGQSRRDVCVCLDMLFNGMMERSAHYAFMDQRAANGAPASQRDATMPAVQPAGRRAGGLC